jgi:signal transduction histidine kinase
LPVPLFDAAVATAVAALAVTTIQVASEEGARPPDALAVLLGVAMGAVLLVRRRWPFGVLLATTLLLLSYHALGYPGIPLNVPLAVALYTAAVAGRLRPALALCAVVIGGSLTVRAVVEGEPLPRLLGSDAVREGSLLLVVLLLGEAVRGRRALAAGTRERLRRAEAEREHEAQRRVVEERLRIARELHDVTAHTIAVIAVQAGVAGDVLDELDGCPQTARRALGNIRAASKQAMAELRATVGVLRDGGDRPGGAPRAPAPGLGEVRALLDATATAGLRVELRQEGEAAPLPSVVDLTAYRIVQEALANVLRHAAAGSATVLVRHEPGALVVEVDDDGGAAAGAGGPAGYGLAGMGERAAALGGRLEAGPRAGGGFRVRARLPVPAPGAAGAGVSGSGEEIL